MTKTEWEVISVWMAITFVIGAGLEGFWEIFITAAFVTLMMDFNRWIGHKWEFRKSRKPDDKTYDGG